MDTQALLTSSEGNIQLRNLYLDDLNIEPSDYEAADEEGKEKMIKDTSERLFNNSSGIIKKGENYYLDTDEKSYNVGIPTATKIAEPSKSFKAFEARIKASDPNKIAPQDFGLVSGADIKVGIVAAFP